MPSESLSLPNGGLWPDAAGVHVNAHGGGLLKEGGLWYWYGEHKTAGRAGNAANVGVRVYSSPDLLGWTDRGVALAVEPDEASDIARSFRARRMTGPWEPTGNPCRGVNPASGLGPEKTWGAQSTFAIPPDETTGGRWIAMFDLWRPEDAIDGRYAWLPADFRDGRLEIAWRDTFPPTSDRLPS